MTPATLSRLDKLFNLFPVLLGGAPDPDEIDAAELALGQPFPPDYRQFVQRYGGAMVGSLPILGLRQAEVMGEGLSSVVSVTDRCRADGWPLPDGAIVVSMDLAGNPIYFGPSEGIWCYDHDFAELRVVAPTFEEFLVELLDATGLC